MGARSCVVPIGTLERVFNGLHRRLADRGYVQPEWDRFDPSRWSDDAIALARRAWSSRTVAEYRSMIVFSELVARFGELRFPLEVTTAMSRLLSDEARHTELCARMAEVLGGHDGPALAVSDVRLSRADLPAHLFVARWTASMFCVGESSSVAVLRVLVSGGAEKPDPCVERVLRTLLRDEMLHDRFGWALARLVLPSLTDDESEWLAADLAWSFAHYDRIHANAGEAFPDAEATAPGLGVAKGTATAEAFRARIETTILPSLARLGVPAYEAWMLRGEAVRAQAGDTLEHEAS